MTDKDSPPSGKAHPCPPLGEESSLRGVVGNHDRFFFPKRVHGIHQGGFFVSASSAQRASADSRFPPKGRHRHWWRFTVKDSTFESVAEGPSSRAPLTRERRRKIANNGKFVFSP